MHGKVLDRLRKFPDKEIGVGASINEIEEAEQELGAKLPNSYRMFLHEFGWAVVGHYEIFGIGHDVPAHLNLVQNALQEQEAWNIPTYLIPFYNDGSGSLHCFDTQHVDNDECPIVFWDHEIGPEQHLEVWANNFGVWLDERLDQILL